MELVSANTKNYLFITMSQFNEQDKLVRARVTMRRDQPFWEGGNSFIACESFRISSAPSQGGLYYKILTDDFYVGAVSRETSPDDPVVYETLVRGTHTLTADSIDPTAIVHGTVLTIPVNICVSHVPAAGTSIVPVQPTSVLPILSELWNDHGIQKGSQVQLLCPNAAGGAAIGLTGLVKNDPTMNITGSGLGPDGLFYPVVGNFGSSEDGIGEVLITGVQGSIDLNQVGSANIVQSADLIPLFTKALGTTTRMEIGAGPDGNPGSVPAPLRVPGMEFMGPSSIDVSGIPGGVWNLDGEGNKTTLKHKIYWDTDQLVVGSSVYIITDPTANVPSHTVYGHVSAIDPNWIKLADPGHDVKGVKITGGQWIMTDAYITWLQDAANTWGTDTASPPQPAHGVDALDNMFDREFKWVLHNGTKHVPDIITTKLQVEIDNTNTTINMNGFNAALPITEFRIRKGNDRTLNRIERRAAPAGQYKYIYTPNELYWTFNNPQGGVDDDGKEAENTPYLLQTHENGGFKVEWDGSMSDFYMTQSMHDALGLNDYFEYNYTKRGTSQSNWDMCLQTVATVYDQPYQSMIQHLPATEVYTLGSNPLTRVNPTTIALGTHVATADGTEFVLVSKQIIKDTEEKNEVMKAYPIVTTDSQGYQLYTWKNLPKSTMGNTQQVSVESFGTYSGINIVIPNLPFQPMLGTQSDDRILASLRLPFQYGTENSKSGVVSMTDFSYYGDLLFNSDSSRSYLRITTDQQLYDCDVEARLIRRDGGMDVLYLPGQGQFEIKLRFLQTQ